MSYIDGIKVEVAGLLQQGGDNGGPLYLSRPTASALAGRPTVEVVGFGSAGLPYLPLFGGAVVAADIPLPPDADGVVRKQRTWLPVMDGHNNPISLDKMSARDVSDATQRCIVKAIAMTDGVGACAYLGFNETKAMLVALGLRPDSDISKGTAYTKTNDQTVIYVPWMAANIAARLTDPTFHWSVMMGSAAIEGGATGTGGLEPVFRVANGWAVQVKATYRGKSHTEWLPIMGGENHGDILAPSAHDWNTAVMRALTKAIAYLTGYGLDTYAGEDLKNLAPVSVSSGKPVAAKDAKASAPAATPNAAPPASPAQAAQAQQPAASPVKPQGPAKSQTPTAAPEAPKAVQAQPEMSENLKFNIERLKDISDVARIQGAIERAGDLFGKEAPLFVKAADARIQELLAVPA